MEIIKINNNFKEEVENFDGISIVDFWANWCGPCKMFAPIFESVSKKFDNIKFCKLNVDEDQKNIAMNLGIMSIPTIVLFKDGVEIKRHTGFLDEDALISFLESN